MRVFNERLRICSSGAFQSISGHRMCLQTGAIAPLQYVCVLVVSNLKSEFKAYFLLSVIFSKASKHLAAFSCLLALSQETLAYSRDS